MIAPDQQEMFDTLVAQHRGAENLSHLKLETILAIVQATEALRQATGSDVPRLAGTLIKLTAQLPPLRSEGSDGGASGARARLIAKINTIAERSDVYKGQDGPAVIKTIEGLVDLPAWAMALEVQEAHRAVAQPLGCQCGICIPDDRNRHYPYKPGCDCEICSPSTARKIAKHEAEIAALTDLNEALEARLAMEATQ
jgi:hypothetical protein